MRDLVLTLIFIGLIPFIFMRPWVGVLAWSWIAYMNPHKLGWGFTHSLPVAMVLGGATLLAMTFNKEKKGIPFSRETIILVVLSILFTVSSLFAWVPDAAWQEWSKVMKILLFTFVTIMLIYGHTRIYSLLLVIAVSLGFYGVKGGAFVLLSGGHNRVYGPPGSFIGDNTALGLALIMVLPLIIALARQAGGKYVKVWRLVGYGSAVLTMLAIVFTYSRGDLLGLAAITPFLFLAARRKWPWVLLAVPLAVVALSFAPGKLIHRETTISQYQQDNSAMQRIQAWGVATNVALHSPLLGAGFKLEDADDNTWLRYAYFMGDWHNRARAAHSIYFQILGEHGFTGLICFLLLIYGTMRTLGRVRKAAKASEQHAWMAEFATALQIGLVGYLTAGAFLSLAYFDLFYAYVAIAVVMRREVIADAVQSAVIPHAKAAGVEQGALG